MDNFEKICLVLKMVVAILFAVFYMKYNQYSLFKMLSFM